MSSENNKRIELQPVPVTRYIPQYYMDQPHRHMFQHRADISIRYKDYTTLPSPGGIGILAKYPGRKRIYYKYCQPITLYYDDDAIRVYYKRCSTHEPPQVLFLDPEDICLSMNDYWLRFIDQGVPNELCQKTIVMMLMGKPMTVAHRPPEDETILGTMNALKAKVGRVRLEGSKSVDGALESLEKIAEKIKCTTLKINATLREVGPEFSGNPGEHQKDSKTLVEEATDALNKEILLTLDKTKELKKYVSSKIGSRSFQVLLPSHNFANTEVPPGSEKPKQPKEDEGASTSTGVQYQTCTIANDYTYFWLFLKN